MKPQTICLLNDSFPPIIDGVVNTVLNYARNIQRTSFHSMVITPDHPEADDSPYDYPVIRYPSLDLRNKIGYMAGIPFSPALTEKLSKDYIVLLHSHCPIVSTVLARQLRQIVKAPLVLTYHTKFDIEIHKLLQSKLLQESSIKALLSNINACDEVWTVSRGAGDNLRKLGYEGAYIVMPNGVDLPCKRMTQTDVEVVTGNYDLPKGVPVYLFVGRMMWYKGIRIILEALVKLKSENRDFRMVFIGDGADRSEIEELSSKLHLFRKCIFHDSIREREILRAWYCRADLFLFPSTFDTNGLVVREAAACSLPSVLIEHSCAAEGVINGINGFLIKENADSLFHCLLKLHNQIGYIRQVGSCAASTLYLSWQDAIRLALHRYQIIIDRYKRGEYPPHRTTSEDLLRINAELMDGLGHLLTMRNRIRRQFRDHLR